MTTANMDPEKDYPVKPAVVDRNADDALRFIVEGEVISMSPEEEKKLVRKIDFMILPLLCTSIDRFVISMTDG